MAITKTITFKNTTDQGNVAAMRIELDECGPFCNAGTHHVKLVMELRNGKEQTRTGNYYKSLEEAEKQIAVFVEGGEKNPALVRV